LVTFRTTVSPAPTSIDAGWMSRSLTVMSKVFVAPLAPALGEPSSSVA
jgi:hypothetical protein